MSEFINAECCGKLINIGEYILNHGWCNEHMDNNLKFEFYDFFISIAYGYLGQFVEEGDEDALAYEVQFEPDEEHDRFVFKQFITKPSHFNESDLTEEMKQQLEDLVAEQYKPSDDVSI